MSTTHADSSPATPTETPTRVGDGSATLAQWTPAERAAWERTGAPPKAPEAPEAPPAATSAEAPPQPEPAAAPKAEESRPAPKGRGLDRRKAELDREIAELRQKLAIRAALREELARTGAPPASPSPSGESTPSPGPPREDQFETYAQYVEAVARWHAERAIKAYQEDAERRQAAQRAIEQQVQRTMRRAEEVQKLVRDALAKDPTLVEKIHPELLEVVPASLLPPSTPINPWNVVAEEVLFSENPIGLLLHFSAHPEALSRLLNLQPRELLRELGRLEASLAAGPTVEPKTVSAAPPPPASLTRHATTPADEVAAAVGRGDFAAYERAMNARELAARR